VTSQNASTVQQHLKKQDVRFGRVVTFKFNQKPYINAGIFLDYIRTVSLRYLDILCGLAVLAQEISVLLTVQCSADVSDDVIRILTEARVRIIAFAPQTTQVFQVRDLTLFGALKRCAKYALWFDENNTTVHANNGAAQCLETISLAWT
jgi:hypothetical protein